MEDAGSIDLQLRQQLLECLPLFHALADPNRQEILLLLLTLERMSVKEIAQRISLSRPAISHHLKIMRQTGVLVYEKRGTQKYYSINTRADNALSKLRVFSALIGLINS